MDETTAVVMTNAGLPHQFDWAGNTFVVTRKPSPWVARRPWWEQVDRIPAQQSAHVLERLMYRVEARTEKSEPRSFDLARDPDGWRVSLAP